MVKNEKYITFTKLDAEGKPLWIRDARKNLVMQYVRQPLTTPIPISNIVEPTDYSPAYDIAGNLLFQHSMDAGDRWMINDAAGKPMVAWDSRGFITQVNYDQLHRPTGSFVTATGNTTLIGTPRNPLLPPDPPVQFEKLIYGEGHIDDTKHNLRGKPYKHFDTAGLVTIEGYDFKGNLLRSTRQLIKDYKTTPDWSKTPALEAEIFSSSTRYDALNRPIQLLAPHSNQLGAKFNVIRPGYNEANLLERVDVWLEQSAEPTALLNPTTANLKAVTNIDYDAKGQRIKIQYNEDGHPIITVYTYDKETFRLINLLSTRPNHTETGKRTLQNLSYTYDPVGNITDIRDAAQQTVFFNNSSIEPSNIYDYDALYRLIHAEGREHAMQNNVQRDAKKFEPIIGLPFPNSPEALQRYSEDYEYDPVGNIMGFHHSSGAEGWVRWYQYALDSNRLLATRSPGEGGKLPFYVATPGGYNAKYTYDVHGNMTSMPHLPMMEWDFKDQLHASQQQVVNNGGTGEKTYYIYDAGGQRVRKLTETQNGQPKDERIYLGGFEVYRKYNSNGQTVTLERETLHIMDDKQRVALVETRTHLVGVDPAPPQLVRFQLGNHLGSAALELDDKAMVISYEEFHPYGTTAYQSSRSQTETPKRYRYTGKERDEETGFSYHGARYYAVWLGRWTSCDPAGMRDATNLYLYPPNPVRFIDPGGTEWVESAPGGPGQERSGPGTKGAEQPADPNQPPPTIYGDKFLEVGSARKAFLHFVFGLPYQEPDDPFEKQEWKRGEKWAQAVIIAQEIASRGRMRPPGGGLGPELAPAGGPRLGASPVTAPPAPAYHPTSGGGATQGKNTPSKPAPPEQPTEQSPPKPAAAPPAATPPQPPKSSTPRAAPPKQLTAGSPAVGGGGTLKQLTLNIRDAASPALRQSQTVNVLNTKQGVKIVTAGGKPLTDAQKKLAMQEGLEIGDYIPGMDAEPAGLAAAGKLHLTPTEGYSSNNVCPHCRNTSLPKLASAGKFKFELGADKKSYTYKPPDSK